MKNNTAIVTCFYTNLYGTKFGGRNGLDGRYRESFKSLLKMTNADFIVYHDPKSADELLLLAMETKHPNVKFIAQPIEDFYLADMFEKYKDFNEALSSHRCKEIQYNKAYWMKQVAHQDKYDYVYWIDIGISHSGLLPDKYMIVEPHRAYECFNNTLYSPPLIEGMNKFVEDKFLMLAIHNSFPFGYRNVIPQYDQVEEFHAIAGILGGRCETVKEFCTLFVFDAYDIAEETKTIHDEEVVLNIMWHQNRYFFAIKKFETWYHEDNGPHVQSDKEHIEQILKSKPFYSILEEFHAL